jgi:hypothetical protein
MRKQPGLFAGLTLAVACGFAAVALSSPAPQAFSFSANQALNDPILFVNSPNFDTEPGIKLDSANDIYPGAIHGVPGGTVLWGSRQSSCTSSGCQFHFFGEVDELPDGQGLALGGGDEDHAIGSFGPGKPGPIVVTSLWLGSVTTVRSTDGGQTWFMNPFASAIAGDDRQWVAADGPTTFYMTLHDVATFNIDVLRSQDGGLTWLPVGTAIDAATAPAALGVPPQASGNIAGEIQVDPAHHILYQIFAAPSAALQNQTEGPLNAVYMGISYDGGSNWTDQLVYAGPTTASYNHIFPAAAVDAAGNVYALWSDGQNIFLSVSTNEGSSWSNPVQVNQNSAALETSIFPWLVAGQAGEIDVIWYGTSAASAADPSARWNVFFAQSRNATSAAPTFTQTIASDHIIHTGPVCQNGIGCTGSGNRDLADLFMVSADSQGNAYIAYADDHEVDSSGNPLTQTYFTFQTGGATIGLPPAGVHGAGQHARGEGTVPSPAGGGNAAHFGFDVANTGSGPTGTVSLVDVAAQTAFVATSVDSLTINGTQAVITGQGNLGSFTLTIDSGADTYDLEISNGYSVSGLLASGGLDVWEL